VDEILIASWIELSYWYLPLSTSFSAFLRFKVSALSFASEVRTILITASLRNPFSMVITSETPMRFFVSTLRLTLFSAPISQFLNYSAFKGLLYHNYSQSSYHNSKKTFFYSFSTQKVLYFKCKSNQLL
ncbi:uncharacterized protein METZ01_LOCUS23694, partial [marine metagenome]